MASTVYYSITRKPTDGITTVWEFSFAGGYIDPRNVKARTITAAGLITELPVQPADVIGTNQLRITPALPAGLTLEIYRDTPKEQPLVDFTDGAILSEASLQRNARQAILAVAEMVDRFADTDELAAETAAIAANAMSTADEALSTAQNAVVKSDSAIATANSALTSAGQANTTAAGAVSTANAASSKADNAVSTANAASSKADAAVATANSVQRIANDANSKSDEALQVARGIDGKATQALDNATTALGTANAVDGKATSALSNSEQALLQATEANDLASGLDQQIRDANDAASGAVSAASQASQDAANAVDVANAIDGKAQQALDTAGSAVTAATEATSIANQAMSAADGAMKGANNLSELTDASAARTNLGLGTAATQNYVPYTNVGTDPGALMTAGFAGIGVTDSQGIRSRNFGEMNVPNGALYTFTDTVNLNPIPGSYGVGITLHNGGTANVSRWIQHLALGTNGRAGVRYKTNANSWDSYEFWTSKNFNPATKANTNQAVSTFSGNFPYSRVDGKPSTFPPTIGTTSTTAKAGNWTPDWSEIRNKPAIGAPQQNLGYTAVGQLAMVTFADFNKTATAGSTYAGSTLRVSSVASNDATELNNFRAIYTLQGSALPGTWRALSSARTNAYTLSNQGRLPFLAIRIS